MPRGKVLPIDGGSSAHGSHQLESALVCPRKFYLRSVRGYELDTEPQARLVGTLFHMAAAWYWAGLMQTPPSWYTGDEDDLEATLFDRAKGRPEDARIALGMYRFYRDYATGLSWSPVMVEQEIGFPVREILQAAALPLAGIERTVLDEVVTARLDLAVLQNGHVFIVDAKTKGKSWHGGTRLERWSAHAGEWALPWQQMVGLHLLRLQLGQERVRGAIIQRVKRELPYDADENLLSIPPVAYREAAMTVVHAVRAEHRWRNARFDEVPAHYGSACHHPYNCDFLSLCKAETVDQRRELIKLQYRKRS